MSMAEETPGPGFPAVDPEPPLRPWWYRFGFVSLAVATAAGCGLLGWDLSDGGGPVGSASRFPSAANSGLILSVNEVGTLFDSRPDGRQARTLPGLGQFVLLGLPSLSPGGDFIAFSDGRIVATGSGQPVVLNDRLMLGQYQVLPAGSPFSAGTSYVIALTEGLYGNETTTSGISVVNLQSGVSTAVGAGSFAAGDPQLPGAFIAVASPSQAIVGVENPSTPDSELELQDVNRPPVVLASATSLEGDLGLNPATPVSLLPVPSPSGSLVAVEVENLLQRPGSDAGLVVMDRSGKTVAVQTPGLGATSGAFPVWSPDGTTLAYVNEGGSGNAIEIWAVGGGVVTSPLPAGVGAAQCLWSPTGAAVLCDSAHAVQGRVDQTWIVTGPGGGPAASVPGPGFAIDWFGG
jgi:hypothetical protein